MPEGEKRGSFGKEAPFSLDIHGGGPAPHGFPKGPTAGAQGLRAAIDCAIHGRDILEEAKQNENLRIGLETWGLVGKDDVKKNFLI